MFTIVRQHARFLPHDIVLQDYHVPKGTLLLLDNTIMHTDKRYFKDAHVFRPERWLEDRIEKKIHPCAVSGSNLANMKVLIGVVCFFLGASIQ